MKLKAFAKINLRLKVLGKLENGYHNLEMINAKINLFDEIEIVKHFKNELLFLNSSLDPTKDTLVLDIVEYFQNKYHISDNFKITITKNIPVGAGLGGGSSDCASIIHYFNDVYNLNLTAAELIQIGLKFGADIPYCLTNNICMVKGIGEQIEPLKLHLSNSFIVIYPNIHICTKDVFKKVAKYSTSSNFSETFTFKDMENDLEEYAFLVNPELKKVKTYLEQFPFQKVLMSGSGSSFICFINNNNYEEIYQKIKKEKNWFVSYQTIYEV